MDEKEKLYSEITEIMKDLADDTTIPRNIRKSITHARETLEDKNRELDVRVASAIYELDEIVNDPNIPVHGRTVVYTIIGKLESLSKLLSS